VSSAQQRGTGILPVLPFKTRRLAAGAAHLLRARAFRESQRDSAAKPRVARNELPRVSVRRMFPTATETSAKVERGSVSRSTPRWKSSFCGSQTRAPHPGMRLLQRSPTRLRPFNFRRCTTRIGRNRVGDLCESRVAQVSKPAVSPTSKSAVRGTGVRPRMWKSATQQTWKSALQEWRFAEVSVAVEGLLDRTPRVTRSSQPWAGGHNPFGIERTLCS
jgi:hypothetical protein